MARYGVVFHSYRSRQQGMRDMMRSSFMQKRLIQSAEAIADRANSLGHGLFYSGPVHEGVTSQIGAHAFVGTLDKHAKNAEREHGILNSVL